MVKNYPVVNFHHDDGGLVSIEANIPDLGRTIRRLRYQYVITTLFLFGLAELLLGVIFRLFSFEGFLALHFVLLILISFRGVAVHGIPPKVVSESISYVDGIGFAISKHCVGLSGKQKLWHESFTAIGDIHAVNILEICDMTQFFFVLSFLFGEESKDGGYRSVRGSVSIFTDVRLKLEELRRIRSEILKYLKPNRMVDTIPSDNEVDWSDTLEDNT